VLACTTCPVRSRHDTRMFRFVQALSMAICFLLGACASKHAVERHPAVPDPNVAPTAQPVASESQEHMELDILEAVYRYQLEHNASGAAAQGRVEYYFLSLAGRKDPPPELLARFVDHDPPVAPVSSANPNGRYGVRHGENGGLGVILETTDVRWLDEHTVKVRGGYYEASLSSSDNVYRVEQKNGVWKVVKDTMLGMS
jgi:hypothetical protein